jgi:phenylpyruvate tautomerase PptA (4-oxalocrotonate tautomerase family)
MVENFQAEIGARIRDFQNAMAEVDRQIRETAMGADADIGANLSEFLSEISVVNTILADLAREHDIDIDADIDDFVDDAVIVRTTILSFLRDRIVIPIEARVGKFQATISRIATTTRAFGELMQTTFQGIGMSLAPALVPIISSLVGVIGQLGPMLGVLAGSTFALGSAFATAGIGAAAFGAIAISNLKDVFSASSELKKLQEKLDDATTLKERTKIMKEMKAVQGSLNSEQTKALGAMGRLKNIWSGITNGLQTQTLQVFTKALNIFGTVLKTLSPMFSAVTVSADNLMATLGRAIDSTSMTKFFSYLNTSAAPMLVNITKSVGNFIQGILSMMVAFGPLSDATSKGFLAMSESFATWAAGLGESKKFQAFMDYVNENMPKIRSIFSDAFQGIINLFAGFGTSSADMMTSLQAMMERFKEWSSTISANQGFQNFINYIKENGPQVIAAIGNIVTAIVNVGIALAPMGAKILELVNSFISWTNTMMENHPILGKIGAAVLVITGLLIAIAPNIIAFGALFGGATGLIGTSISLAAAKVVTGTTMMITSMAKAVASAATAAATFIAKWAVIGAQALVHAAKVVAAWVLATGQAMVSAIAKMAASAATFVAKWVLIGAQSMVHAAKVAAAWILSTGASMASSVGKMIATSAVFVAKWVWMGVQALAQAARMAAAWFIALGPVGWVIGAVVALAVLIIANWDKIKSATVRIWTTISQAVQKAWEKVKEWTAKAVTAVGEIIAKMPGKVKEFASKMLSAGKDLVMGLINGIKGMAGDAINAITGVVDGVVSKAKSLLGIKSPSRVFAQIGVYVGTGMANGVSSTQKANEKVMNELTKVIQTVAKANAKAIAVIAAEGEKERTAIQKESAAKAKEIERKAAEDIHQINAVAKAKKRKLTVSESLRIEQIRKDSNRKLLKLEEDNQAKFKKINDKQWDDMVKREAEANKERYDGIQKFADNKLKLEGLSAIQEANIWRKAADSFKEGTQEKIDAQSKYRDMLRKIEADVVATNEKYSKQMIDISEKLTSEIEKVNEDLVANSKAAKEKLIADEDRLNNAYSSTLEDRYKTLRNFAGLFEKFDMEPKETGSELLNNLQSQVDGFKSWESEITKLSAKGINDGLLDELRDMGPKALPQLLALNSMTSEQLTQYSSLFSEKSALARAEAEEQLIGMKADTERQITQLREVTNTELTRLKDEAQLRIIELRSVAKKELAILQTDWIKDITKITTDTNNEFKTLTQIGKDAVAGLISGMNSMQGELQKEAKAIATSVQKTIKSALQIKSPSRVLERLGEYAGQGLASGLNNSIRAVMAVSKELALAATPVLAGVQMAPMDTQSQMDSLHRQIKQELSVDMSVNHTGSAGNGGTTGGNTYYVSVNPSSVKEFNDLVQILDQQAWDSN